MFLKKRGRNSLLSACLTFSHGDGEYVEIIAQTKWGNRKKHKIGWKLLDFKELLLVNVTSRLLHLYKQKKTVSISYIIDIQI